MSEGRVSEGRNDHSKVRELLGQGVQGMVHAFICACLDKMDGCESV